MFGLKHDSTVKEVEGVLRANHVRLQSSVGGQDYAVDDHFEKYVLEDITTVAQALEFCDKLDSEALPRGNRKCTKATEARGWYSGNTGDTWIKYPAAPLANSRRVGCGCHEVGSFARKK